MSAGIVLGLVLQSPFLPPPNQMIPLSDILVVSREMVVGIERKKTLTRPWKCWISAAAQGFKRKVWGGKVVFVRLERRDFEGEICILWVSFTSIAEKTGEGNNPRTKMVLSNNYNPSFYDGMKWEMAAEVNNSFSNFLLDPRFLLWWALAHSLLFKDELSIESNQNFLS